MPIKEKIKVIYEEKNFVAVYKPAHIAVHQDGKNDEYTVADFAREDLGISDEIGEPLHLGGEVYIPRNGIVHRIDKETSGILLIAKNQDGYNFLKKQFKQRAIKKTYLAFVYGVPKEVRGLINVPIGRSMASVRKWATGKEVRGETREAETRYKVIKPSSGSALLMLWPQTGRTHQLRVHLKAIGHPIIADNLYGGGRKGVLGFTRLALHAFRLIFTNMEGKELILKAPLPIDFKKALKEVEVSEDLLN